MQVTKVACPLCRSVTTVNDPTPIGKSVHCQQCGAPFTVGADDLCQPTRTAARRSGVLAQAPVAEPAAAAPWWVDEKAKGTPAASPSTAVAEPCRPAAKAPPATPAAQAVAAGPPAATAAPAAPPLAAESASGVNRLLVLAAVGGSMVLLFGIAVALTIVCCLRETDEPDMVSQVAPPVPKKPQPKSVPTSSPSGSGYTSLAARKVDQISVSSPQWHPQPPPAKKQPGASGEPNQGDEDTGVVVASRRERDPLDALPMPPKANPTGAGQKDPLLDPIKVAQQPPANKHVVSPAKQKEIDAAIAKGVAVLKGAQQPDGTWKPDNGRPLGTTALVTLALLECGVPATDPCIAASADYVRKHWQQNTATYEISLAILLLDKLAQKKDKLVIQALALRLIHGQNSVGGWTYHVDLLSNQDAGQLLANLKKTRPKLPTFVDRQPATVMDLPAQIRLLNPLEKANGLSLPTGIDKNKPGEPSGSSKEPAEGLIPPVGFGDTKDKGGNVNLGGETMPGKTGEKGQPPVVPLPKLGAVQPPKGPPKDGKGPPIKGKLGGVDDNSNSQFAMLALWAARRHEVPVEHALLLAEQRYRTSQHKNGSVWTGWSYHFQENNERPSMTCVGLLGLALGKGVSIEMQLKAGHAVPKTPVLDAQARDGFLNGVAPHLVKDAPIVNQTFPQGLSLYFMWSVERVAVLYDLMKIGDQDWYLWGVDILLPTQRANGSWETRSYHGSNPHVDTCFALLFLKRVNFVQDLTDLNLRLYMAIPESNPVPK
jgi:hypothetical protein